VTDADKHFQAACGVLDDLRRLIAAGKLQRWDVVKWTVAINIALAGVAIFKQGGNYLVGIALVVAVIGLYLVACFNLRITRIRKQADSVENYLVNLHGIPFSAFSYDPKRQQPKVDLFYDKEELIAYAAILILSFLGVLFLVHLEGVKRFLGY